MTDDEMIAEFLRSKGATQCPPAIQATSQAEGGKP
jgi:hypothetical protein